MKELSQKAANSQSRSNTLSNGSFGKKMDGETFLNLICCHGDAYLDAKASDVNYA